MAPRVRTRRSLEGVLVLVTGGAGFIGSHVVGALVDAGHGVRVLDVRWLEPTRFPPDVAFVRRDVWDRAVVEEALRGVDAVHHQAAMVGLGQDFGHAPEYEARNDLGTAVLLTAMARRRVSDLVLAGSMVYYGEGRYECARHGTIRPGPRRVADLDAGRFEPVCPRSVPRSRTAHCAPTTSAAGARTPWGRWPPRSPRPAAGPSRW